MVGSVLGILKIRNREWKMGSNKKFKNYELRVKNIFYSLQNLQIGNEK
jgi:hypothetical protein